MRGFAIGAVLGLFSWIVVHVAYVGVNVWRYVLAGRLEKGERVDQSLLDANDAVYGVSALTH